MPAPAAPAAEQAPAAPKPEGAADAGATGPSAPEMLAVPGGAAAPAQDSASLDDDLSASPWNKANNPGFNRDLLPSAMIHSQPASPSPVAAPQKTKDENEPSGTGKWFVIAALVALVVVSVIAYFQIKNRKSWDGQIALPMGSGQADDAPADSAPTASATAKAKPVYHGPVKPKSVLDDPYADVPATPKPTAPAPAPTDTGRKRIFGNED